MLEMDNEPIFVICPNCENDFAIVFHHIPDKMDCEICGWTIYLDDLEEM